MQTIHHHEDNFADVAAEMVMIRKWCSELNEHLLNKNLIRCCAHQQRISNTTIYILLSLHSLLIQDKFCYSSFPRKLLRRFFNRPLPNKGYASRSTCLIQLPKHGNCITWNLLANYAIRKDVNENNCLQM